MHLPGLRGMLLRMAKTPKRPRDPNQLAHFVVGLATEGVVEKEETAASKRARLGGVKGGPARASVLTPEQRAEIAQTAASARWKKS